MWNSPIFFIDISLKTCILRELKELEFLKCYGSFMSHFWYCLCVKATSFVLEVMLRCIGRCKTYFIILEVVILCYFYIGQYMLWLWSILDVAHHDVIATDQGCDTNTLMHNSHLLRRQHMMVERDSVRTPISMVLISEATLKI